MKRNKWWIAIMITLGACSGYPETYPEPVPVRGHLQREDEDRKTGRPAGLIRDTGMSLMDNGMILMLGMLEPLNRKDSTVVYAGSRFIRP